MKFKISNYVTRFRKSPGIQHSVVIMLERWYQVINKGEYISVMHMDFLKDFDSGILRGFIDGLLSFKSFIIDLILFLYSTILSYMQKTTTFLQSLMIKKKLMDQSLKAFRQ